MTGFEDSFVHGLITHDRTFEGRIHIDGDIYNVERATKYFNEDDVDFHTVMYRQSDVEHEKLKGRASCASSELHKKQQQMFSKDKAVREPKVEIFTHTDDDDDARSSHEHEADATLKYRPHNATDATRRRQKRAIDYAKQQCTLFMQADVTYYEYWGSNAVTVIDEFIVHVQAVNDIFELVGESCDTAI